MSIATPARSTAAPDLSLPRLLLMGGGYLLMGVGLVLVKWPLLPDAHTLPLYESVTLCLLTAMSLLAFLGLRYPVKLLPPVSIGMLASSDFEPWLGVPGIIIGSLLMLGSCEFVGRNEERGWKLVGSLNPITYVAWSVWLIASGVVLSIA